MLRFPKLAKKKVDTLWDLEHFSIRPIKSSNLDSGEVQMEISELRTHFPYDSLRQPENVVPVACKVPEIQNGFFWSSLESARVV